MLSGRSSIPAAEKSKPAAVRSGDDFFPYTAGPTRSVIESVTGCRSVDLQAQPHLPMSYITDFVDERGTLLGDMPEPQRTKVITYASEAVYTSYQNGIEKGK